MRRRVAAIFLVGLTAVSSAQEADRPAYNADAGRSGYTRETIPTELKLSWSFKLPHAPTPAWARNRCIRYNDVFQSVVAGGKVFIWEKYSFNVRSGKKLPRELVRSYGCGGISASRNMLFFRSGTIGYLDLPTSQAANSRITTKEIQNFGGIRPGCYSNIVPADGIVLPPDSSSSCSCSYFNPCWIALQPAKKPPHRQPALHRAQTDETRTHNEANEITNISAAHPQDPYVWDLRYIDTPVVRFYDPARNGTATTTLYASYQDDPETALYLAHRYHHTTLGTWLTRYPSGFVDGMNVGSRPVDFLDPEGAEVYWASRDVADKTFGNHHFILIIPNDQNATFDGIDMVDVGGGKKGFTIGVRGNLVLKNNEKTDLEAVKEYRNDSIVWYSADMGYKGHKISHPKLSDKEFVEKILSLARIYEANFKKAPITYRTTGPNCATFINAIFQYAGIPEKVREAKGEFGGFDWGEEETLPAGYFKEGGVSARVQKKRR